MTCGRIIDLNIYLILNLEQEQSCRERPAPLRPSFIAFLTSYCVIRDLEPRVRPFHHGAVAAPSPPLASSVRKPTKIQRNNNLPNSRSPRSAILRSARNRYISFIASRLHHLCSKSKMCFYGYFYFYFTRLLMLTNSPHRFFATKIRYFPFYMNLFSMQ